MRLLVVMFLLFCFLKVAIVKGMDDEDDDNSKSNPRMFNFASHQAGAVILDKSPSRYVELKLLTFYYLKLISDQYRCNIVPKAFIIFSPMIVINMEYHHVQRRNGW